jgi:ribosome-associated heat shock protein Hsp15
MDKWLWAVRVYKTRGLATQACNAGNVRIDNRRIKASYSVKIGEVVHVKLGEVTRSLKVIMFLDKRVGAKIVDQYAEDLTPSDEYKKTSHPRYAPVAYRDKGLGRPTKKDRRAIEQFRS